MWLKVLGEWLARQRQASAERRVEQWRARQDFHRQEQRRAEFVPWHFPPFS
jgi:hypothetical protein